MVSPTSILTRTRSTTTVLDIPGPSSPTGRTSRELWTSLGHRRGINHVRKTSAEDVLTDYNDSISLVLPPPLPSCSIQLAFQVNGTDLDLPPAFYPGQSIPTVLTFSLDRASSLSHSLAPVLTMSMVGTLHIPDAMPRTIICVSVSLAEGLALWARDAIAAHRNGSRRNIVIDPEEGLPGGTYSLPLTVQVPSSPRLPPTFTVDGACFAVTYSLCVSLSCDDAMHAGRRIVLAEASRAFEMIPETMPTQAHDAPPQTFWVRTEGAVGRRQNNRWVIHPSIPTTAYSPTSSIPLSLTIVPPSACQNRYQILIRLALIRQERCNVTLDTENVVHEVEVSTQWGWVACRDESITIEQSLPVMTESTWRHGFSTILHVAAPSHQVADSIHVASTFQLVVAAAFLPVTDDHDHDGCTLASALKRPVAPSGHFISPASENCSEYLSASQMRQLPGTCRRVIIPLVIGSVSEPRGAMHAHRWSDLQIDDRDDPRRLVNGEAFSCENGWLLAPPSYDEAVTEVPYVY